MSSTPWKANITICKDSTTPSTPVGKTPPCSQRFETLAVWPTSPQPKIRTSGPAIRSAVIARILISANQNSSSPNSLTATRLTP